MYTIEDSHYVAAPFDHAKADIILRSSDNIDFRVFKLFLILASSSFETLFAVPQSTRPANDREIKDGLAVIRVQESSRILDTLLRFCYPCSVVEDPKLEVMRDLVDILEAAQKYSLHAIEKRVHQTLTNHKTLEADPLRCFAVARRGRASQETLLAAKYTLMRPLIPARFPEIDLITATDLLALLAYHKKCGDAVYALRMDSSWIERWPLLLKQSQSSSKKGKSKAAMAKSGKKVKGMSSTSSSEYVGASCLCTKSTSTTYETLESQPPEWWEDFMMEMFVALRDKPCSATIESLAAKTVQTVRTKGCPACSVHVSQQMQNFTGLLTSRVGEVIAKTELLLVF